MKQTLRKISSKTGSSLIIALVFMLVCVFVGGSVLVAATVNGNRIAGSRDTQQNILNQRSICSVFVQALSDDQGKINIIMPYTVNASLKTPSNPYNSSSEALKYVICKVAGETVKDSNKEKSLNFSVTDPTGAAVNCVAVCKSDYTVYIRFADDPQVQLKISGRNSNSTVTWYSAKIIKAVQ